MKTDKHNMDLQQLLGTLEHAGRDARRQQELSEMIDCLAGVESGEHRHGAWWWVSRVAAAACLLFFISTAVRIWFIPTKPAGTLVAEVEMPALDQHLTNTLPTPYQRLSNAYHGSRRKVVDVPQQEFPTEVEEAAIEENEYFADIETVGNIVDTAESQLFNNNDIAVEQEMPQVSSEAVQPAQSVQPESVAVKSQERKRSLFSSLFHRAEPSMMDGTLLAFNLL